MDTLAVGGLSSADETVLGGSMTNVFEQTLQVLVSLAMSPDAESLDDLTLNREVDALIDAYLVWTRTRRPAGFRPRGYNEREELARAFWEKVSPTPISERIRARVAEENDV
jgi:hypothetical protein